MRATDYLLTGMALQVDVLHKCTPLKFNIDILKITVFERTYIFQAIIVGIYVKFWGGISSYYQRVIIINLQYIVHNILWWNIVINMYGYYAFIKSPSCIHSTLRIVAGSEMSHPHTHSTWCFSVYNSITWHVINLEDVMRYLMLRYTI